MKFGIFLATQWPEGADLDQEIGNLCAQVRAMRDNGFDSVWLGQHFLTGPLQMLQTTPLLARLAPEGEGMTFGTAIYLLGMLNPVVMAEEAASLDWITDGNFVFGAAIGYRREEFDALNAPYDTRVARFEEALPLVRRLWNEKWVTHKGDHFTIDNLSASIRPKRPGGPPVWIGAQVPAAVRRAARMGDAWVPAPTSDIEVLGNLFSVYREARTAAGLEMPDTFPLMRECFVGPTHEAAMAVCRGPMLHKYEFYASWGETGSGGSSVSLEESFDAFMANRFIVGDEAEVADEFARYRDALGVDHMILRLQCPGVSQADVIDAIERIGRISARLG